MDKLMKRWLPTVIVAIIFLHLGIVIGPYPSKAKLPTVAWINSPILALSTTDGALVPSSFPDKHGIVVTNLRRTDIVDIPALGHAGTLTITRDGRVVASLEMPEGVWPDFLVEIAEGGTVTVTQVGLSVQVETPRGPEKQQPTGSQS